MNSTRSSPTPPEFLTTRQVAEFLGISARSVTNLRDHGVFPCLRIGRIVRFRRQDVMVALNAYFVGVVNPRSK